jgi:hypothetical protein
MKTVMLGWEFPPFISGGLGTACYGLTKAMGRMGTEIVFLLPRMNPIRFAGGAESVDVLECGCGRSALDCVPMAVTDPVNADGV